MEAYPPVGSKEILAYKFSFTESSLSAELSLKEIVRKASLAG